MLTAPGDSRVKGAKSYEISAWRVPTSDFLLVTTLESKANTQAPECVTASGTEKAATATRVWENQQKTQTTQTNRLWGRKENDAKQFPSLEVF